MAAMETKEKMQIRALACRARVHPGCEPTFVLLDFVLLDALRLLPNIRAFARCRIFDVRCAILTPQCTVWVMFLRRSRVLFVEILCIEFHDRRGLLAQPADAPT
jgi:hypothetical protein